MGQATHFFFIYTIQQVIKIRAGTWIQVDHAASSWCHCLQSCCSAVWMLTLWLLKLLLLFLMVWTALYPCIACWNTPALLFLSSGASVRTSDKRTWSWASNCCHPVGEMQAGIRGRQHEQHQVMCEHPVCVCVVVVMYSSLVTQCPQT